MATNSKYSSEGQSTTRILLLSAFALILLLLVASPLRAQDLTGLWTGNDGGTYYVRQVGDRIFWYGESGDAGRTWTNVATGKLSAGRIILDWADVPKGAVRNSGLLVIRVEGDRLVRVEGTGGFGGSEWRRGASAAPGAPSASPAPPVFGAAGPSRLMNYALASNGGQVVSGFTGYSTPRSLVNDGQAGPDDSNPYSTKTGIAAYSTTTEPFQVNFQRAVEVQRIGIMHKYGGGAGPRYIIERARMVFSDGSSQEVRFNQAYAMQYVDVYPRVSTFVRVEPLTFYKASDSRWGIIEFEVLGVGAQAQTPTQDCPSGVIILGVCMPEVGTR